MLDVHEFCLASFEKDDSDGSDASNCDDEEDVWSAKSV